VLSNIAETRAGNASSNFDKFAEADKFVQEARANDFVEVCGGHALGEPNCHVDVERLRRCEPLRRAGNLNARCYEEILLKIGVFSFT
jgi:hypothetical protein